MDINTDEILSEYRICRTKQYQEELDEIINEYKQEHLFISVSWKKYSRSITRENNMIEIFGYGKLVDEVSQKFKDLLDKHRLRKFKFSQISSMEVCLCFMYLVFIIHRSLNSEN
jgi:hypothetical protein